MPLPSHATQGIASFFGGLAKGITDRLTQRDQQKLAEKAEQNRMLDQIASSAMTSDATKDKNQVVAWWLQQRGIKDPKTLDKFRNVIDQAHTLVPQVMDRGQSPGTSIGLGTPGGGQAPAATGPQASPGRSVALRQPPGTAIPSPQFYSPDEMEARAIAHEKTIEEIRGDQARKTAAVRAETTGEMKVVSRSIATKRQLGLGDSDERVQVTTFGDGHQQYQPVEGKTDTSPEGRLAKMLKDSDPTGQMTDADALKQASQQLLTIQRAKLQTTLLGQATAAERLKQLRTLGPLHEQLARDHADALEWSTKEKKDIAAGDPKTILDKYRALSASIVKDKGGDPTDVQTKLLKEAGFDRDELEKQLHPPSATAQEIADLVNKGGEGTGGAKTAPAPKLTVDKVKWGSIPADVRKDIEGQFQGAGTYTHKAGDGTTTKWHIDASGAVTTVK